MLIVTFAVFALGGADLVCQRHGRWFVLSRATFEAVLHLFLGVYKVAILMFDLVPEVALRIVASS